MTNFQQITSSLAFDLEIINKIILDFSEGKSSLIKDISHYIVESGGKRIRPILLILSAKMCGTNSGNIHHNLAACIELIHTATLLHDDVIDNSQVRRGKKTANAIWDNKANILVGDYIFSIAFQLMVKSKDLRILDLLSKTSSIIADGEIMQLQNSNNIFLSEEKYLEIIYSKTAILFSASCEVGALMNNCKEQEIVALRDFGKNLGLIFQIIDDILDYSSSEITLGKDIGNDFFEGKITIPIIYTYQRASQQEKVFIEEVFSRNFLNNNKNQNEFEKILDLINKYKAFEVAKDLSYKFKNISIKSLDIFPQSKYKEMLIGILNHSIERIF